MSVNAGFTGIFQVRRFHLSVGHGGAVHCLLDVLPQIGVPPANGTLFVTDGVTTLTIPGCRLDRANITWNSRGQIVRVLIQGPTWKWKLAGIDGVYNVPRADGSIEPGTEKTPQELATLLFQAMRVQIYDVSGLPNNTRPFVNWRGSLAFNELTKLCHDLGCDFGLDVQGTVARIWTVGDGAELPVGGEQTIDFGMDYSESPDRIRAISGPMEVQSKLLGECVMPDTDGTWKLADDVSYAPADGWLGTDPNDPLPNEQDKQIRGLAKRWLWRAYRMKSQADGSHEVPVYGEVNGMEDILPLQDRLLESYDENGIFQQTAYAEGTFAIGGDPDPVHNTEDFERIETGHRLDKERGIVIFDTVIYKLDDNDQYTEADVYFVCTYNVRDPDTFGPVYYAVERIIANNDTGYLPLHRPELKRKIIALYDGDTQNGTDDNEQELETELESSIDALQAEFQTTQSVVKRYRGLIPVILDGAIRQVSYMGNCEGRNAGCFTVAARNTEWEPGLLRRFERRRRLESGALGLLRSNLNFERRRQYLRGE